MRRPYQRPWEPTRIGRGGTPADESSISWPSRRSRVSGRFAEVTQWRTWRRNDGALAENQAQAAASAWNRAVSSAVSSGSCARSNE
jgi:hypothetical protein